MVTVHRHHGTESCELSGDRRGDETGEAVIGRQEEE